MRIGRRSSDVHFATCLLDKNVSSEPGPLWCPLNVFFFVLDVSKHTAQVGGHAENVALNMTSTLEMC